MKTKIFALLLAGLMLLPMIASCKKNTGNNNSDTLDPSAIQTEEDEITPNLPAVNYDRTINILQRAGAWKEEWDPELENTDVLSDAIYERNAYLSNKYGIDFAYHHIPLLADAAGGQSANTIKDSLMSGTPAYDIISYSPLFLSSWSQEGLLAQINDLPHIDFSQPWWYSDVMDQITVDGNSYYAFGSSNLSMAWTVNGVLFNKTMFEKYYPQKDLYQEVRDNQWTLDSMLIYAEGIYADIDNVSGVSIGDQYGIVYAGAVWYPLFYGSGAPMVVKNNDGDFVADISGESVINRITKIIEICNDRDITREFNADDEYNEWMAFAEGRGLFLPESISATNTCRKNMTDDYGVLPAPMYTASQGTYYSTFHPNHSSAMAVGKNVPESDWEMLGAIITDAAYMSKKVQWPALFEAVLKGRTAKDPGTLEMLDIVYSNLILDPVLLYDQANDVDNAIRALIQDNATTNVYSTLAGLVDNVNNDILTAMNQLRGIQTTPDNETSGEA